MADNQTGQPGEGSVTKKPMQEMTETFVQKVISLLPSAVITTLTDPVLNEPEYPMSSVIMNVRDPETGLDYELTFSPTETMRVVQKSKLDGGHLTLWLEDEDGNRVDGREAYKLLVSGVYIKRNMSAKDPPKGCPFFAVIRESSEGTVVIEDTMHKDAMFSVPRDKFFEWFEID